MSVYLIVFNPKNNYIAISLHSAKVYTVTCFSIKFNNILQIKQTNGYKCANKNAYSINCCSI